MGKDKKQTTTQRLDPRSQGYVDQMRAQAGASADMILNDPGSFFIGPNQQSVGEIVGQFMNPYTEQVIGNLGAEFDQRRAAATTAANQAASAAGAFGSARHGVREGVQLGELDRAQMQQVGGLLSNQWNQAVQQGLGYNQYQNQLRAQQAMEPVWRAQQAAQLRSGGLGPTGMDTTQIQKGNLFKDLAGAAMTFANPLKGLISKGMDVLGGDQNQFMPPGPLPTYGPTTIGHPQPNQPPWRTGLPDIPRPPGW